MIDDALRKSKPSVLAAALKTSRPVVKTVLPTGPKPSQYATKFQPGQSGAFVPAPVEAPIAAPVPAPAPEAIAQAPAPAPAPVPDPIQYATKFQPDQSASVGEAPAEPAAAAPAPAPAFVAPKNQEELDALIAGGISSSDEEKNQRAMEETIKAKFQADRDLNVEEQKIKVANAEKEAKAAENYASEFRVTNQKQKEILDSSYGYFAPTQENAKDIAGIFSILMLATMGSGTQNKYSGMNALASLTGAMKGYKEGREDVYRKEMASYDKNVAEFTRRTENSLKELKIAQEELAVDKDAAMARMRAVAAADSGSMASLKLRSGRLEEAIQLLKHQADSIRTHNEKVAALDDKKRRTDETISHNIETEELRARSLTERERADKANEEIKKILAEEKVRTDQANESIRSILANEKIRADQKNETIKELLANERIRADKSNEVIKGLLVEIASRRATTYEKSVVERTRHDRAMEGLKGLKGSGGSPRSATNERFTNNVIRATSEGLRAVDQLKSLDSKTGGGYFGTVVGKGDLTSSAAAALAVNVSSEREKMYNATISGLSLEIAMAMSGGYKPDVGLQRSLQETHRVTEDDTELTAAYKVADVISKFKASLTVTPSYTKEQKQNTEDLLKRLDQYDSPENVIQKFNSANTPRGTSAAKPKPVNAPADAKLAKDGSYYSPDPARPGKYLKWD